MYDPVYLHPANNRFLSMKHVFNNSDSGISMFFIWIFIIVNDVELFSCTHFLSEIVCEVSLLSFVHFMTDFFIVEF